MNERECETCIKRKSIYCPNSDKCFNTSDKPYYQNRIMLLEENKQLKQQIEQRDNIINYCKFQIEKEKDKFPCPLESERWLKGRISAFEEILNIDKGEE